ncbi:MAG: hypothetical protein PUC59_08600 [Firmicutes bacterium]|nr:hypothetical protein [Bacillota bacterium]
MVKEKYLPYVEPEKPTEPPKSPKELKKEKRENFWFYNKTKIIVALCAVAAILFTWQPWNTTIDPDYTVGLMSQYYWNETQLEELENMLRPYGKDLNGDGVVKVRVSLYQMCSPDDAGLGVQEIQAYTTRFVGDLQTGEVILFIGDEANIKLNGIDQGLFARADDELSLVGEDEKVSLDDVAVNWKTCDAISKNEMFSHFITDFYFAIRGKEGTIKDKDTEYFMAAEMFFRLIKNEPYDPDLLDALLSAQTASSGDASAADSTVSKAGETVSQVTASN